MAAGHRWHSCGDELLRFLVAAHQENGQVHWPTLVAATSALSGEMALIAKEREFPESGYVQSRKVAEFVHSGADTPKTLWGYCALVAREAFGLGDDDLPKFEQIEPRLHIGAARGYPDLSVPAHLAPRRNPFNAGPRHRKSVLAIAGHHRLDYADCAFALATASMKMIGFTRPLGLSTMASLALECMLAASRYAPRAQVAPDPAFGLITDVLPRSSEAPVRPPLADDEQLDIWGDAAPQEPARPSEEEERPRRAAGGFGRRR